MRAAFNRRLFKEGILPWESAILQRNGSIIVGKMQSLIPEYLQVVELHFDRNLYKRLNSNKKNQVHSTQVPAEFLYEERWISIVSFGSSFCTFSTPLQSSFKSLVVDPALP